MKSQPDKPSQEFIRTTRLPIWAVEAAAAILFLIASALCILLAAYLFIGVAAFLDFPGSVVVVLAAAIPVIVPMGLVALVTRPGARNKRASNHRSSWIARLDPGQPSDAVLIAAAEAALSHFGGNRAEAGAWAQGEAIRFLQAGDLRRNLIAVRLKRAIASSPGLNGDR